LLREKFSDYTGQTTKMNSYMGTNDVKLLILDPCP
jgi:hypothetical protein